MLIKTGILDRGLRNHNPRLTIERQMSILYLDMIGFLRYFHSNPYVKFSGGRINRMLGLSP